VTCNGGKRVSMVCNVFGTAFWKGCANKTDLPPSLIYK
jgi:hypothetical protein